MSRSATFYVSTLLCLGCLVGCSSDLPATVLVTGRVTFDGQSPPTTGYVSFQPLQAAEGNVARPGSAAFDAEGRFVAGSFSTTDGLVPGSYRVNIECWQQPPDERTAPTGISYVPEETQLSTLEVAPGSDPIEVSFDIPAATIN